MGRAGWILLICVAVVITVSWIAKQGFGVDLNDAEQACQNSIKNQLPVPDLAAFGVDTVDGSQNGWYIYGNVSEQGQSWKYTCSVFKSGRVVHTDLHLV